MKNFNSFKNVQLALHTTCVKFETWRKFRAVAFQRKVLMLFNTKYVPQKESIDITPELVGEPSDDLWQLRDYIPDWELRKMQKDMQKGKF